MSFYSEYSPAGLVPSIASLSASAFTPGQSITVLGSNFTAGLEQGLPQVTLQTLDSGGGGGANFQSSVNGLMVDLSSFIYTSANVWSTFQSSFTFNLPASTTTLPPGWYNLRVVTNGLASNGAALQVGPALPNAAPANLTATVMGSSSVTFSWSAVAGANGYDIYSSSTSDILGITSSTVFTLTGLAPATPVQVGVSAFTLLGDGPAASSANVFTPPSRRQQQQRHHLRTLLFNRQFLAELFDHDSRFKQRDLLLDPDRKPHAKHSLFLQGPEHHRRRDRLQRIAERDRPTPRRTGESRR